jgi:hypothetical protein
VTVAAAATLYLLAALLLCLVSVWRAARGEPASRDSHWHWRQTWRSLLLYALAFNLTFFLQELFLVLPKALTPGLHATLYHNNHSWQGTNPLARLFQGSGALAILVSGALCLWLTARRPARAANLRLFVIWMAYCGCFMALAQVVVGALSARSDLGMAMQFLGLDPLTKTLAALCALVLMALIGRWLSGAFLATAPAGVCDGLRPRLRYVFEVATVPALAAVPLIALFRVPRELSEVLIVPAVVSLVGVLWVQAAAASSGAHGPPPTVAGSSTQPLAALVLLLMFFQLVLRRGISL